jgi:predicted acyltransferase
MNNIEAQTFKTESAREGARRLVSLDALRGFDMLWIVGADAVVEALRKTSQNPIIQRLAEQLDHVEWAGFHFEDLIFPMFVFIVGVSLVFSLGRIIEEHGRRTALTRVFRRAVLLYLLGVFYYGGFSTPFEKIRLMGVLQRIAICYLFAALIYCYFGTRGRLLWCVGLLIGYWVLMAFVPVPGGVAGDFAEGHNLANWVDKQFLPLRKWDGDHDPEGLLSTLPAIANCVIGVLVGVLIRDDQRGNWVKFLWLVLIGAALAGLGYSWSFQFPIIKKIWTSSFVLVACGLSSLLFALFFLIIDVIGWRLWAQPFVWIGVNPIAVYMLHNLVDMEALAKRFVGGQLNGYFGEYGPLAIAIVELLITLGVAWFLYRRRIFLRL